MDDQAALKKREEAKREAMWDPAERWRVLQETITWADAQAEHPRNSPARCIQEQARRLRRGPRNRGAGRRHS